MITLKEYSSLWYSEKNLSLFYTCLIHENKYQHSCMRTTFVLQFMSTCRWGCLPPSPLVQGWACDIDSAAKIILSPVIGSGVNRWPKTAYKKQWNSGRNSYGWHITFPAVFEPGRISVWTYWQACFHHIKPENEEAQNNKTKK